MLNLHKEHKNLVLLSFIGFVALSLFIAVMPAYRMSDVQPLPDQPRPDPDEMAGLHTYIAEGCVACHTQQVRNIEMDKMWGERPSIPSDYYYSKQRLDIWRQSPSILGSERTGPDLTNIGKRQPGEQWHLLHLYNPRSVVKESVMPGYPWLFEEKREEAVTDGDVVVPVPEAYYNVPGKKIVASKEALQLTAYLQSLKQTPLPGSSPEFIPAIKKQQAQASGPAADASLSDGKKLYMQTCAACHQENGQGLAGAFPPLAGSAIVNDDKYEMLVQIILQGYDARSEYGQMPAFADQLTDEEIAAIANHERSSWGNSAAPITADQVKQLREFVNNQLNP